MANSFLKTFVSLLTAASVSSSAYCLTIPKSEEENAPVKQEQISQKPQQKIYNEAPAANTAPSSISTQSVQPAAKVPAAEVKSSSPSFNSAKTAPIKYTPSRIEKSTGTCISNEKGAIGLAMENDYPLLNAELGLGKNVYLNAGIGMKGYSPIEKIVTKTGTRFDAYGRTNTQDKETISTLGIDKRFNIKNGLYWAIGASAYNNSINTKKNVEEKLMDKSGKVLASNNDSYDNTNNNYSTKAKLALGWTHNNVGMELYAKLGGKESNTGLNFKYCFRGQK